MASIASNVQWGSSPTIYFDFSYEKKRDGSTQYYKISVSSRALTGSHYFGYPIYVQISLDGAAKTSYTLKNASPTQWSSALSNTTGWLSVSNKTSGTTALSIRVYSGNGNSRDTTYNYSLAIDPAASTISCTTAHVGSNPRITINSASSNFVHTINCSFGGRTATVVERTRATTITDWTIPEWFYEKIPNAKTGEAKLYCNTYNASSLTALDVTECKLNFTTDETICKPTVSGTVIDTNPSTVRLTGDAENTLIRYCSKALCTISTTLNKNAGSITAKTINNTAVTGDTLEIPNVETGVFDFWAKDSREYPNSDKVTKTLIPYIKLTAHVVARRTDPTSGNATLTIKGSYYNGSFGRESNALTVGYKPSGTRTYTYITPTITGNEYEATAQISGLTYTEAFSFDVTVGDELESITQPITIAKGIPVFDWGENDFNFNVPISIAGMPVADFIIEQGTSDFWTYRKWYSGIAECWGRKRYTKDITITWGALFEGSEEQEDYVDGLFAETPTTTITPSGVYAGVMLEHFRAGDKDKTPSWCVIRPIQGTEVEFEIVYHAVGRWNTEQGG
jgi:hypothetical protein